MDDHRQALRPPRFGMKGLLIGMTVLCVILAGCAAVGTSGSLGLLLIVAAIFAHLAGAHTGKLLRDHGSRPLVAPAEISRPSRTAGQPQFAPTTNLHERRSLGIPLLIAVAGGGLFSAVGGCIWIMSAFGDKSSVDTLAVGGVAFGLLGAFATFLLFGFAQVAFRAFAHAQKTT